MLSRVLLLHTATAGLVAAQGTTDYNPIIAAGSPYGSLASMPSASSDQQNLFAQANQNPNVSASFDFNPFYLDGVFNGGTNAPDLENTWTLSINVTDFSVPDARPQYPSEQPDFQDPHLTNTVLELDWHENESLRSALNGSTASVCVAVTTGNFLPNVTNQLTADNTNGDCVPVLGEECTNALRFSSSRLSDGTCRFDLWEDIPECAASFGASRGYDQYGLSRINWNVNGNRSTGASSSDSSGAANVSYSQGSSTAQNGSSADAGYDAVAQGTNGRYGFLSIATGAYNGTNTTLYEEAAARMHVVVMSIAPAEGQAGLVSNKALCVRADPRELQVQGDEQSNGGGSDAGSGSCGSGDAEGEGGDGNSAASLVPGAGAFGATLTLAGLWMAMFAVL